MDWRDVFPRRVETIEFPKILGGAGWWLVHLLLWPGLLNIVGIGLIGSVSATAGYYFNLVVYSLVDVLVLGLICRGFLKDAWDDLWLDKAQVGKTVALALGAWAVLSAPLWLTEGWYWPVVEAWYQMPGWFVAGSSPILGFLLSVLVMPLVMGLFYGATAFGSVAQDRPWLGYGIVALVATLPCLINYSNGEALANCLLNYIAALPLHLCACWAYHKSDNIWSAIGTYGAANLLLFLALQLLSPEVPMLFLWNL